MKKIILLTLVTKLFSFTDKNKTQQTDLVLKYDQPEQSWTKALLVGNITSLSVISEAGKICRIRYYNSIVEFPTAVGKVYNLGLDFHI